MAFRPCSLFLTAAWQFPDFALAEGKLVTLALTDPQALLIARQLAIRRLHSTFQSPIPFARKITEGVVQDEVPYPPEITDRNGSGQS